MNTTINSNLLSPLAINLASLLAAAACPLAVLAEQPPVPAPVPAQATSPSALPLITDPAAARFYEQPVPLPGLEPLPPAVEPPPPQPILPRPKKSVKPSTLRRFPSAFSVPGIAGNPDAMPPATAAAGTALDVDINADPRAAAQQYQKFLSAFDAQREGAAHAVFGLGESYRKQGRIDEARAQYGRILREFVDFPELARESQKQLTENQPDRNTAAGISTELERTKQAVAEESKLVSEEITLLEGELANARARISQGVEPSASIVPIQREILQLKQRLVRLKGELRPTKASR